MGLEGYLCAFASSFFNGSFPVWSRFLSDPQPDPVVFNGLVALGVFCSGVAVIPFSPAAEFVWTLEGFIGGVLFVFATLFSFLAIPRCGLSTGQAVWCSCAILVAFVWGSLGPGQVAKPVKNVPLSVLALLLLMLGATSIVFCREIMERLFGDAAPSPAGGEEPSPLLPRAAAAAAPGDDVSHRRSHQHAGAAAASEQHTTAAAQPHSAVELTQSSCAGSSFPSSSRSITSSAARQLSGEGGAAGPGVTTPSSSVGRGGGPGPGGGATTPSSSSLGRGAAPPAPASPSPGGRTSSAPRCSTSLSTRSLSFQRRGEQELLTAGAHSNGNERLVGLASAATVGLFGGSVLVPLSYAPKAAGGVAFLPSFGLGALAAGSVVTATRLAWGGAELRRVAGHPLGGAQRFDVLLSGLLSGFTWNAGNFCSIAAQSYYALPYGIAYPILQCAFFFGGLWGIYMFGEVERRAARVFWFGTALLAAGVVLLGAYGPGAGSS